MEHLRPNGLNQYNKLKKNPFMLRKDCNFNTNNANKKDRSSLKRHCLLCRKKCSELMIKCMNFKKEMICKDDSMKNKDSLKN